MAKKNIQISPESNALQKQNDVMEKAKIRKDILGKYLCFNDINDSITIVLNPENTFFKITRLEILPSHKEGASVSVFNPISLSWTVYTSDVSSRTETLNELNNHSFHHYNESVEINKIISSDVENTRIVFNYTRIESYKCEVHLYFETINKRVDLQNPFEEFSAHLKLKDNVKILFSAPFGQGKTTFLNHYFEKNEIRYEVFKLYPVNYAVSHNEDIFKYIKAEILFQLMSKDVKFDKLEFSYSDSTYSYFSQNIDKIISPLLSILPKVGESAANVFDKIFELSKAIKNHKTDLDINDEKDALKYIKELYEKEGSIFEDNFYTQLIRQLLEGHAIKHNKKNILIIDDIDRIDPDHIFRIFNVFSANFDSSDYRTGLSNKFSFDKIILVCDLNNIKKIFQHRYGSSTSFDGYLGKYYSRNPYIYDNIKAIETITKELTYYQGEPVDSSITHILTLIMNDLVYAEEITLRDLVTLLKHDFYKTIDKQVSRRHSSVPNNLGHYLYFSVFAFLENIFDRETILYKIKICKKRALYRDRINYQHLTSIGFMPFINSTIEPTILYNYKFKDVMYQFKVGYNNDYNLSYNYYIVNDLTIVNAADGALRKFNEKDFYDILILNAEKYNEL